MAAEQHNMQEPQINGQQPEGQPDLTEQQHTITDSAAEPATGTVIDVSKEELQQRLEQAEAQAAEYKDQWLRATADYKNYKRRTEQERGELIRNASSGLILKILPVLDDFERAMASVPPDVAATSWWAGMQLIDQKLRTILESEGVRPIEALGQEFDPNCHHAVIYEEAQGQENKVVAELQKGYTVHDRVLRPTMVKVGKG